MTQAERTRIIYTHLLEVADGRCTDEGTRRDKLTGMQGEKIRKERKEKRKTKSRKQGTNASKKIVLEASP